MTTGTKKENPDWTLTHDIALIYLALTHGADEDLDSSEVDAMARKLGAWHENVGTDWIKTVMQDVMLVYVGTSGEQMLEAAIASVATELPKSTRIAILNDLADIASADGEVVLGEADFIQQLAREWNIDREAL